MVCGGTHSAALLEHANEEPVTDGEALDRTMREELRDAMKTGGGPPN